MLAEENTMISKLIFTSLILCLANSSVAQRVSAAELTELRDVASQVSRTADKRNFQDMYSISPQNRQSVDEVLAGVEKANSQLVVRQQGAHKLKKALPQKRSPKMKKHKTINR
jgi:hypothetical protein